MLILLPAYLSELTPKSHFAPVISEYIAKIDCYFVENEKTARRIIKFFCPEKKQSDLKLILLNKYTQTEELGEGLGWLKEEADCGLLSEAGLPCLADPGNILVSWCHENGVQVVPINGPSSMILALIASGFNGQQFTFSGYLPIDKAERRHKIVQLEQTVLKTGTSQIFMETPYRNNAMLEDLCKTLSPQQKLCVASNIGHPTEEFIQTLKISEWRKKKTDLHKIPTVFVIGR
ncbi:SAM-dependent methyltransferase [Chryseobacterium sp. A301]